MKASIVSGILAQALVSAPKITTPELYTLCVEHYKLIKDEASINSLIEFRGQVSKWITDGTIPGYEFRLGRTGGIYKESTKKIKLDSAPVIAAIKSALATKPRITQGDLFAELNLADITEPQFRVQIGEWFKDGTLAEFESRKGPMGGIYWRGADSEAWVPETDDDNAETLNGFSVQVSPTIKIVCSDDRNWTIQKLSGETWMNKAYHSDINSCLKSVIKHTVNGEFKLSKSLVQLKDLYKVINEMETRVLKQLEMHVAQTQAQA